MFMGISVCIHIYVHVCLSLRMNRGDLDDIYGVNTCNNQCNLDRPPPLPPPVRGPTRNTALQKGAGGPGGCLTEQEPAVCLCC